MTHCNCKCELGGDLPQMLPCAWEHALRFVRVISGAGYVFERGDVFMDSHAEEAKWQQGLDAQTCGCGRALIDVGSVFTADSQLFSFQADALQHLDQVVNQETQCGWECFHPGSPTYCCHARLWFRRWVLGAYTSV
eukprot:1160756-Pelagomonas_calceolata.AAC.10